MTESLQPSDSFGDRLLKILSEMPRTFSDRANRDRLLRGLPSGPVGAISRNDAWETDLYNIVTAAEEWGNLTSGEWALDVIAKNALSLAAGTQPGRKLVALLYEQIMRQEGKYVPEEVTFIPIAIFAMNRTEFEELNSGIIFEDARVPPIAKTNWEQMTKAIETYHKTSRPKNDINQNRLTKSYTDKRDEWVPLTSNQQSMKTIVDNVIAKLTQSSQNNQGQEIECYYLSEQFLSKDSLERINTIKILKTEGGILIIDAISMFHPILKDRLIRSHMEEQVAFIVVSPLDPNQLQINRLLEEKIYTQNLDLAFEYFREDFEISYEFGIGNMHKLQRWLHSILPNFGKKTLRRDQQEKLISSINKKSKGIHTTFSGGSEI